jgi:regulator of RNase E activity RraA
VPTCCQDLVVGDPDRIVVIPQAVEAIALECALRKVEGEDKTREAPLGGAKLADVFAEYNVL